MPRNRSPFITRQRDGFFAVATPGKMDAEVQKMFSELPAGADRKDVYAGFMAYETKLNGKNIACEKTPQNIFYIDELQKHFPRSKDHCDVPKLSARRAAFAKAFADAERSPRDRYAR
ncbi:MAG: hypothetical protein IPL86_13215 [Flavobacteriales bacterium]|nr:hypothetical protein [Flavobacteriales bacterium]